MKTIVKCHSGYKAEETPTSFTFEKKELPVKKIVARWYEPGFSCFRVLVEDGRVFTLVYDQSTDRWKVAQTS